MKAKLKQHKLHSRLQLWLRWHSSYPLPSTPYQSLRCQASIMKEYNRKTVMELSPLWLKSPWTKVRLKFWQHVYILLIFYNHPGNSFWAGRRHTH